MEYIRKAEDHDFIRIAEIEIFNYRLYFYPIFQNDEYYFDVLRVPELAEKYRMSSEIYVYDDGTVKGFISVNGKELKKLFVEPVLHNQGIGAVLLEYAIKQLHVEYLWALEKNVKAIRFYQRHGFYATEQRKLEEDTTEYLVMLKRDMSEGDV